MFTESTYFNAVNVRFNIPKNIKKKDYIFALR